MGKIHLGLRHLTPGQKGIVCGKKADGKVMLRSERGNHSVQMTKQPKIMHLKQMYQLVKGLGIPHRSSQTHICSHDTPHRGRRRSGTGT